jgi:hypothetical protein
MRSLAETMVLNVSQIFPATPVCEPGRRTEKSPACMACSAANNSRKSRSDGAPPFNAVFPLLLARVTPLALPRTATPPLLLSLGDDARLRFHCRSPILNQETQRDGSDA